MIKEKVLQSKSYLSNQNFKSTTHKIPICIGKDISGNIEVIDLSKTPHLISCWNYRFWKISFYKYFISKSFI